MAIMRNRFRALERLAIMGVPLEDVWNVGLFASLDELELRRNGLASVQVSSPLYDRVCELRTIEGSDLMLRFGPVPWSLYQPACVDARRLRESPHEHCRHPPGLPSANPPDSGYARCEHTLGPRISAVSLAGPPRMGICCTQTTQRWPRWNSRASCRTCESSRWHTVPS